MMSYSLREAPICTHFAWSQLEEQLLLEKYPVQYLAPSATHTNWVAGLGQFLPLPHSSRQPRLCRYQMSCCLPSAYNYITSRVSVLEATNNDEIVYWM